MSRPAVAGLKGPRKYRLLPDSGHQTRADLRRARRKVPYFTKKCTLTYMYLTSCLRVSTCPRCGNVVRQGKTGKQTTDALVAVAVGCGWI